MSTIPRSSIKPAYRYTVEVAALDGSYSPILRTDSLTLAEEMAAYYNTNTNEQARVVDETA